MAITYKKSTSSDDALMADINTTPLPDVLLMESRPVAEIGLRALDAGRPSVVPGLPNQATAFSNRVLPRSFFPWLAYKLLKR